MGYKLCLQSKKLSSGKCQVKFVVLDNNHEVMYGYLLSEANSTLREVVKRIERQVKEKLISPVNDQSFLYNLAESSQKQDVLIFQNT